MNEIIYKSIIEGQPAGYACLKAIYDKEGNPEDYKLVDCNSSLEKILGEDRKTLLEKTASQIISQFNPLNVHPMEAFNDVLFNKSKRELEKISFDQKSWYKVYVLPLEKDFIVAHFVDITKEFDHFIELENFFNINLDLLCIASLEGYFLKLNKAWEDILGYTIEDLESRKFLDFVHPDDQKATLDVLSELGANNKVLKFVNRYRTKSGDYKYIEWNSTPYGNLVYAAARDVTLRRQAEESLKTSEENFRTFFETIEDFIFITNIDGEILYSNSAVENKLGYSRKELNNLQIKKLTPLEKRDEVESFIKDLINNKMNNKLISFLKKDGTILACETRFWHGKWNDSECLFAFSKDISKEMESLEKFNKIFENNPTLMSISRVSDRKFIDVNKAFLQKTGYSKEEVINHTSRDLSLIVDNEKKEVIFKNLLNSRNITSEEQQLRKKNGEILNGLFSAEIIESQGESYYLTVVTDITEQKKAEDALIYQSKMQNILMNISTKYINFPTENIKDALNESLREVAEFVFADKAYILDINNNSTEIVFQWSNQKLSGLPSDSFSCLLENNTSPSIIIVPDVEQLQNGSEIKKCLINNKVKSFIAIPISQSNGDLGYLAFESIAYTHFFSDVEISLLILYSEMVINVRNRVYQERILTEAKDQAEEANISKSRFLANMSHEIRTPMNAIVGFLQLLEINETKKDNLEYISNIKISTDNLLYLINNLLDLSKIEAGKVDIENIPFNLQNIIEESAIQFSPKARLQETNLNILINPDVPKYVVGDPSRIKQILANLLGNAVKFTEHGNVYLNVSKVDTNTNQIRFAIKDTGIGMSHELVKKIFTPFTQADSSSTRKYGGTGLGLSICKSLVELMGGVIDIQSKEGFGSTVSFTLTLEKSTLTDDLNLLDFSVLKGKKILIVDENETSRETTKIYLQESECMVGEAKNANSAISLLIKQDGKKYDAAIIDHDLTDMNASDLASTLKTIPYTKDIPLISINFSDNSNDEEKTYRFDGFLFKPFRRSELLNCITKVFENHVGFRKNEMLNKLISVSKTLNVLIVDDNDMNRNFLIKILEMKDINFDTAINGQEAVECFKRNDYDIILMDCQMPIMDGYDATKAIRKLEKNNSHVLIVAMTAFAMKGDKEKCISYGMDDYLSKPLDINRLSKILSECSVLKENKIKLRIEREKILIVDDEPMNLKLLEAILKAEYELKIVTNGKDAIEQAVTFNPDIILLDIMMPEMNGYEACKILKELSETKDIPVVFLTAMKDEQSEEFGFKMGAVDYIIKPFSIPIVKGRIKNHIEQKKQMDFEKENSYIDELTKIANRKKFNEVLQSEWLRAKRTGTSISLLFLDIDFFKKYNDFYGHLEGDNCIYLIAQILKKEVKRSSDLAARWGGEEFTCILPETETEIEGALIAAERIRNCIEELEIPHEKSTVNKYVTVSIGVISVIPTEDISIDDFISKADLSLYTAKNSGRNCVRNEIF